MLEFNQFLGVSLDGYGPLIDWEMGRLSGLNNLLLNRKKDYSYEEKLELFPDFESATKRPNNDVAIYRDIGQKIVTKSGIKSNFNQLIERASDTAINYLVDFIRNWQPFRDTVAAWEAIKHKYKVAVISHIDDDLFAATAQYLKVEFEWLITASQVRSYKSSTRNFEIGLETMAIPCAKLLHVDQSLDHDIVPAPSMEISTVWRNRRQDKTGFGRHCPPAASPTWKCRI